jgi:Tfp pilus assembly protein PilF
VRQHTIEREKATTRKKAAIGSAVTSGILLFFYFLYQNGGYERIRDGWFPNMASKAYIEEGTGFLQKRDYAKALDLLGKAKACDPKNSEIYVALASAYMGLGRFTDAAACCEKAIEIKPDSGLAHGGLAAAYDLLGDYDKASSCAERSLALFEQGLDSENARKAKILLMKIHEDRENALHR